MAINIHPFGIELNRKDFISLKNRKKELETLALENSLVIIRAELVLSDEELLHLLVDNPQKDLLHWDFGPIMEMRPNKEAKNYLFSREEVPFHWDGAFHLEPKYLLFNCVAAPPARAHGETLFCNTELVLKNASPETIFRWKQIKLCYETNKIAHYGGKINVAMIQNHPQKHTPILRYAEPVLSKLNPVFLSIAGDINKEKFEDEMKNLLYSPQNTYAHKWQAGDIVIADNFSLLHGRRAFKEDCDRHFRRVQVL